MKSYNMCRLKRLILETESTRCLNTPTIKTLRHLLLRKPRDLCTCILYRKLIILFFQAVEVILTLLPPIIGFVASVHAFYQPNLAETVIDSESFIDSITPIFATSSPGQKISL